MRYKKNMTNNSDKRKRFGIVIGSILFTAVLAILVITFANAVAFTKYPFAGFFFQPNRYVSFTERNEWEGMKHGVKALDRLQSINNEKVSNGTQALRKIQGMPKHSTVKFEFLTPEGNNKKVDLKLSDFTTNDLLVTFFLPFLIGLFFLVIGFVVFLLNPLKKVAFINYLSALFIALFYSTSLDSNTTYWFYRLFALYPLVGATAIHLILTITASKFLKKHRVAEFLPYVVAGIIVALQQTFLYTEYSAKLIYLVSPIFLVGCVIMVLVYLILYYFSTKDDVISRRKTRFYLIAFGFGTIIPALWSITFAFGKPLISLDWAIALSIFYPIFTGYAITREDLFSLERIVRTSIEYLLFTGLVVAAYFVIVTISSMALQSYVKSTPLITTILTILVIVVLTPFRKRVQSFIDRTFYPERYDVLEKINEISSALLYVRDRRTLGVIVSKKISASLSLNNAGLLYCSYDGKSSYYTDYNGTKQVELTRHGLQRIFPKAGSIEYSNEIFDAIPPRATRKEIQELKDLAPMYFLPIGRERTRGLLVIGPKRNIQSVFIHDDFSFLQSLQPQLEVALVNAELHEQKAEQERLATIGEFSSVIIHEIKNPLGIIKLSSGTLKKRLHEDPKAIEVLGFIEEEVSRMNDTVSNFLDYAKPKYPVKRRYTMDELKAYIENLRPEFQKEQFNLILRIESSVNSIYIDPDHLKQMLLNLIINAKEANPSDSTIYIDVSKEDDNLEITVSDNGEGIAEEHISKVFDPFFTTKEHGTGLGLSVTKQLAKVNGGDVRYKKHNGLSVFVISLPLVENAQ